MLEQNDVVITLIFKHLIFTINPLIDIFSLGSKRRLCKMVSHCHITNTYCCSHVYSLYESLPFLSGFKKDRFKLQ